MCGLLGDFMDVAVGSEEIEVGFADKDVAVGTGSNSHESVAAGKGGLEAAVAGNDGREVFRDLLSGCMFEFVEYHILDEDGNTIDRASVSHNLLLGRPRTTPPLPTTTTITTTPLRPGTLRPASMVLADMKDMHGDAGRSIDDGCDSRRRA